MTSEFEDKLDFTLDCGPLDTADSVARAAHIWIRSVCCNEMQGEEERRALAGGLIAGLCERLDLNPRLRELVGYVYMLLEDEGRQALSVSRSILDKPVSALLRAAYDRGRFEAAAISEMLAFYDRKGTGNRGGSEPPTVDRSDAE